MSGLLLAALLVGGDVTYDVLFRQFDDSNYVFIVQTGTVCVMNKSHLFPHLENLMFCLIMIIII